MLIHPYIFCKTCVAPPSFARSPMAERDEKESSKVKELRDPEQCRKVMSDAELSFR